MTIRRRWVLGPGAVAAGKAITGPVTVTTVHGVFDRLTDAVFNMEPLHEVLDLAHFTGREWIIDQIDHYIATHPKGYVVVQGEAGVGKSALAAHLAFTRPCVHHFTQLEGARSPEQARRSLAAQLIGQWQLYDLAPGDALPAGASRPDWLLKVIRAAVAKRDAAGRTDPIVLVVDGLDEADPPAAGQDTGIPLGLPRPEHLPRGVFLVVTTRFGTPLPAVRGPVDWTTISVDGTGNLADLRTYLCAAVSGAQLDQLLVDALARHGVDPRRFVDRMVDQCRGVWMYLRYVLDDIRERRRDPTALDGLPDDLSGYYLEQIHRWRTTRDSWPTVCLPLLATLAALRRPASRVELARLAGVDKTAAERWLEGELRPFLELSHDGDRHRLYNVRHQSLRDLFAPSTADSRDGGTREILHEALRDAHERITVALIPPGSVETRRWSTVDTYVRTELPEHAAESGRLDELVYDPGFLLTCDPPALLRRSSSAGTEQARAALAAYEFTVDSWPALPDDEHRLWWLHVWARKARCDLLAERAVVRTARSWVINWALWNGTTHRILTDDTGGVLAMCSVPLPDGRTLLATGGRGGTVQLWDPVTGDAVGDPFADHTDMILTVCVLPLPDGRTLLATAGRDGTLRLWDPTTGQAVGNPLTGHVGMVSAVCALPLPDGRTLLASTGTDGTVRLWNPMTGNAHNNPMKGHRDKGTTVCALPLPDGRTVLASAGNDATLRLWDPTSGMAIGKPLTGHRNDINAVCALPWPDGRTLLASAGNDATVRIWDPVSARSVATCHIADGFLAEAMCPLPISRERTLVAVGGFNMVVELWDPVAEQRVGEPLAGHTAGLRAVCAVPMPDGRTLLASAADDDTVRLWDPGSGHTVGDARAALTEPVLAVCAVPQPNGRTLLATSGREDAVRLWDAISGEAVGEPLAGQQGSVEAMCVLPCPDGRSLLATGGLDGTIQLWDLASGKAVGEPMTSSTVDAVHQLCAVPLGGGHTLLAAVTGDGVLQLWDPVGGIALNEEMYARTGPVNTACAVRLSRDGRTLLAVAGYEGTVELRDPIPDVDVGDLMTGHGRGVFVTCSLSMPDGRTLLATGGSDETVRLWDPVSCTAVGEPLTGHTGVVDAMCELRSRDGRTLLATGGGDRTVRLWDPTTGKAVCEPLVGHDGSVNAMCALPWPDGRTLLATAGNDRALLVWANHC